MTTYLTADPHFGHLRMLEDKIRSFASVAEMNQVLIANWNRVVHPRDLVWVIGDFAFNMPDEEVAEIYNQLNGRLRLVLGNHDIDHSGKVKRSLRDLPWEMIVQRAEIKHAGQRIVLDHYAGLTWNAEHYGSYLAYGHSHGKLPALPGAIDVGMDAQNYHPISVEEFVRQADASIRNHQKVLEAAIAKLQGRSEAYAEQVQRLDLVRPLK